MMAWATIVLAVVTFALAIFTALMWWWTRRLAREAKKTSDRQASEMQASLVIAKASADAAQKSADIADKTVQAMEDTAMQELRAYVLMKLEDGKDMFYDSYGRLSAPLIIKNFGQTPAHNIMSSVQPMSGSAGRPQRRHRAYWTPYSSPRSGLRP